MLLWKSQWRNKRLRAERVIKLLYAFKYGRALSATLEAADWKLEYIAMASGSKITEGMRDVYKLGE